MEWERETASSIVGVGRGGADSIGTCLQRNSYLDWEFYRNAIFVLE
jgi:hypothetical protein